MKKIIIGILLAIASSSFVEAQVSLQPNIPAVGLIQKDQLWNVLIINNTTTQFICRLELVLRDRSSGQEILTASTIQFVISQGTKQLNLNILNPVQYNYILAGANNNLSGLLPAGSYTACYTLVTVDGKNTDLSQECIQFDTEPLTPPMLIYPADSALLDIVPSQLSWIPPTPDG
ncbi:MAG TPA: hypothetical protein VK498_00360, partial [Ferruginibacter sp.]|nr:hypothetical protein [Ferruginibacter sp.]